MLRRPTADQAAEPTRPLSANARFEREVQLTSQLTHPNTIAIYDYGRTRRVFYYAMEYLDGISLGAGREVRPTARGRVIHILQQACGSLAEAHAGLIHRDIKPANIMLTRRGGEQTSSRCSTSVWSRPPTLDGRRTDRGQHHHRHAPLFAAGNHLRQEGARRAERPLLARGRRLLPARWQAVSRAASVIDITVCKRPRAGERPPRKHTALIASDLERLILQCLAKTPSERPQKARLRTGSGPGEVPASCGPWTSADDAAAWWLAFAPRRPLPKRQAPSTRTIFLNRFDGRLLAEADK